MQDERRSLSTQDEALGASAHRQLERAGHLHPTLRVAPREGLECGPGGRGADEPVSLPILFRTYLRHGAEVCGPPAIDREFKTIDFLTLLDVEGLEPEARSLYLGRNEA